MVRVGHYWRTGIDGDVVDGQVLQRQADRGQGEPQRQRQQTGQEAAGAAAAQRAPASAPAPAAAAAAAPPEAASVRTRLPATVAQLLRGRRRRRLARRRRPPLQPQLGRWKMTFLLLFFSVCVCVCVRVCDRITRLEVRNGITVTILRIESSAHQCHRDHSFETECLFINTESWNCYNRKKGNLMIFKHLLGETIFAVVARPGNSQSLKHFNDILLFLIGPHIFPVLKKYWKCKASRIGVQYFVNGWLFL